jgi:hypothetical protein
VTVSPGRPCLWPPLISTSGQRAFKLTFAAGHFGHKRQLAKDGSATTGQSAARLASKHSPAKHIRQGREVELEVSKTGSSGAPGRMVAAGAGGELAVAARSSPWMSKKGRQPHFHSRRRCATSATRSLSMSGAMSIDPCRAAAEVQLLLRRPTADCRRHSGGIVPGTWSPTCACR